MRACSDSVHFSTGAKTEQIYRLMDKIDFENLIVGMTYYRKGKISEDTVFDLQSIRGIQDGAELGWCIGERPLRNV